MRTKTAARVFTAIVVAIVLSAPVAWAQEKFKGSFEYTKGLTKGQAPVTELQQGDQVVEQVNIIDEMIGRIDWENKMVYAVGDGVPPKHAISPAQARVRAKRAAIDEAYGRLLEMVQEVRVDAESTTRNFVNEHRAVRTKVEGFIKNAEIEKLRHFEDGSFQVMMRMPLHGQKGLTSAIFPLQLQNVHKVRIGFEISREEAPARTPTTAYQPSRVPTGAEATVPLKRETVAAKPPKAPATPVEKPYTGLIVDAQGLGAKPAMYPRILTESGEALFDVSTANPNAVIEEGLAEYRKTLEAARAVARVGDNPLIIKATKVSGTYGADLVVSDEDARKVAQANEKRDFLGEDGWPW